MPISNKPKINVLSYSIALSAAFIAGAVPAALIYGVDPYEMFRQTQRPTKIQDIAEKAHYPLWKLAKYNEGSHDTIILGDSRARALRDKYWHELGMEGALNLAYGGGTIPEIYSTFNIIKGDAAIKNLVIGIQLRSFDETHKDGMDRVPEAKYIVNNKIEYLKNWSIFKTAWNLMTEEEKAVFESFDAFAKKFSISAKAEPYLAKDKLPSTTQRFDFCRNCDLPSELLALSNLRDLGDQKANINISTRGNLRTKTDSQFGSWTDYASLYQTSNRYVPLPKKMARQVTKNAKSDWDGFKFSKTYWSYLEDISIWASDNDKNLIFVIPPTIEDMQRTIYTYGLSEPNHSLRVELSKLGNVVDFDFSNELTQEIDYFSDAYHFNAKISKKIVGEIVTQLASNPEAVKLARKRADLIRCDAETDKKSKKIDKVAEVQTGKNCRIWRAL